MKVLYDAYNISLPHGTGVATYGRNLIESVSSVGVEAGILYATRKKASKINLLNEISICDDNIDYPKHPKSIEKFYTDLNIFLQAFKTLAPTKINDSGIIIFPDNKKLPVTNTWIETNVYRNAIALHRSLGSWTSVQISDTDLAHWTYPLPIKAKNIPNIYTIHDLVPLKLPYATADYKKSYYDLCVSIAKEADHIVTVSESSKLDIIKILGVPESKVTNTYQSVSVQTEVANFSDDQLANYIGGVFGLDLRNYFLYFGAIEPKKNIVRLLESYLGSAVSIPLVIVGAPGWGSESEIKMINALRSLDTKNRIIWLSYLPRNMLISLIASAKATLFPSLYEGFGLPVAESMALGTPVLTSNTSSLAEITGGAALLVDPYNTNEIINGIKILDESLDLREELSERGKVQAQKFLPSIYSLNMKSLYSKFS